MEKKHSIFKSFKFAFDGIAVAVKRGRNFRIQILLGLAAIAAGIILKVTNIEWVLLFATISSVLILELINTSLEKIVDMVSPEIQEKAKIAKDVAAASVLIAAISSVAIGLLIFAPKIVKFI